MAAIAEQVLDRAMAQREALTDLVRSLVEAESPSTGP